MKSTEEIRKIYFDRKLSKLLNEMQGEGATADDFKQLETILESFKQDEIKVEKQFNRFSSSLIAPSVQELRGVRTEEQKQKIETWLLEASKAIQSAKSIMESIRVKLKAGTVIRRDSWLNAALEITVLITTIDQDRVYKDQLFREVLTQIVDSFGISRAEAEERAKLTKEYRDYRTAVLFRDNLSEFVMLAKKYSSDL